MHPSALIFDVDGTLTETAEIHRNAFNVAFRELQIGWSWSAAVFARLVSVDNDADKIACYVDSHMSVPKPNASGIREILTRKNKIYRNLMQDGGARLRPGVARLLREARNARVPLAIATTAALDDFEALLQNHLGLEIRDWFDVVITRDQAGLNASEAYAAAVQALGVDPSQAVAFDDCGPGVRAALSNGLKVIAVPGIYTSSDNFEGADIVISDLGHPAAPFQVIRGDAMGYNFVSIESLRYWYTSRNRAAA